MSTAGRSLCDDELVSSAVTRRCRHRRLTYKVVGRVLLACSGFRNSFVSFSHLPALAQWLEVDAAPLLWHHTPLRYAAMFSATPDFWSSLTLQAQPTRSYMAYLRTATQGLRHRRFCPECVRQELRELGESYWHCGHQLPGVLWCVRHACALRSAHVSGTGMTAACYLLPHECAPGRPSAVRVRSAHISVAQLTAAVTDPDAWTPLARPASWYRDLAQERGWLDPKRPVRAVALRTLLRHTFGQPYLRWFDLDPEDSTNAWPALLFRPGTPDACAPLKHLLLEVALRAAGEPPSAQLSYIPSGLSAVSRPALDAQCAPRLARVLQDALACGTKLTLTELLGRAGCSGPYRHSAKSLPRLVAVVNEFKRSPAALRPLHVH